MGSRWASRTGKHLRNPNPSWGPLTRILELGARILEQAAAQLSSGRVAAQSMCSWDQGAQGS